MRPCRDGSHEYVGLCGSAACGAFAGIWKQVVVGPRAGSPGMYFGPSSTVCAAAVSVLGRLLGQSP